MTPSEKLKEIANQLRHPHGSKGMEMATMMQETNANMTAQAISALAIGTHDAILEIGHGNAAHVLNLCNTYPSIHYQGLEVSTLMHDLAKENNLKLIDEGRAAFTLYNADSPLPYANDTFDKIFTVNTHYFWEEPRLMFADIYRVLQPRGAFALTFGLKHFMQELPFTAYHFKLYEVEELQEMAVTSGFKNQAFLQDTERIPSKTGEWVNRQFATLVFIK
ncbi:class I SAM-dependent methyltransferase [Sphingobacterium sp. MYb382]|uniref:class I SAM-dependent methyltransferase n=1 Tax=Sphingobacterium sp. MYb382 TaxID=2745278 RepID=UPI0030B78549